MADVALALFWHQHQPYYPDDVGGTNPMPWVRLHGVKDYYGMAQHLLEYPEMHCTINLVPSLVMQLLAYTDGKATDRCLDVSRIPAADLPEADALFLLDHFFMANWDRMIRPYPRYAELLSRRGFGQNGASESLRRFNERDLRDLQVWFNLTWIHPLAFERDAGLRTLLEKGRGYTEEEKSWLLDKHFEILREVLPLHRKLAESGQVELTTTPFFHPILPLLFDKKLAREAMPEVKLPSHTAGYLDDAAVHVRRAVEYHTNLFGTAPRGMWPAEGSVCQAMIPLLAEHGIRWIATDEEILSASTQGAVSRDHHGHVRHPEQMYRPYKVAEGGHELGIIFRDHALSDMIGFHYQRSDAVAAADDLLEHCRAIGRAMPHGSPTALVSIILDGENCWEHYPDGGVPFLRALYQRCSKAGDVRPVKVGEFVENYSGASTLPRLFAGSWISHNFAIWVGHDEDNTAWDALHRTREHLRTRQGQANPEAVKAAWEEMYIAEGSDWFWWYGDDHSCAQDALFDYLFRKHLQNVYLLLGDVPPPDLARPISRSGQRVVYTMPRSFLDVKVDGRRTFLQWLGAGRYQCQNERAGAMSQATHGPIKELHFGFNRDELLVRVDCQSHARSALAPFQTLRLGFVEPTGWELLVNLRPLPAENGEGPIAPYTPDLYHEGLRLDATNIEVGVDQIVEIAVPFERLAVESGQPLHFFIELLEGSQGRDRAPREGTINLNCPSPHFEQIMWDV